MSEEPGYQRVEREAVERLQVELAKPSPSSRDDLGCKEFFDPWSLFPALYGSYSSDFDDLAIDVLNEIADGHKTRGDLAAEMFREMLCTANLCDYGSSPRVCFPTVGFRSLVPALLEQWGKYRAMMWGTT